MFENCGGNQVDAHQAFNELIKWYHFPLGTEIVQVFFHFVLRLLNDLHTKGACTYLVALDLDRVCLSVHDASNFESLI